MGEKDIAEKKLFQLSDVLANAVNVTMFHGKEVIHADELEDALPKSTYSADDSVREQERDVAKFWKGNEIRIAFLGIENQTDVDDRMPLRVIGYDGAAYRSELNRKDGNYYPVVTIVFYFGTKTRWTGPIRLKECFDIPKELEPFVNDYKIHVVEVAWLPDEVIQKFDNAFRPAAEYLKQECEKKPYEPNGEPIKHPYETMQLLYALSGEKGFLEARDTMKEGDTMTMESISFKLRDEKFKAEGIQAGEEKKTVENLKSLMKNLGWPIADAMKALDVSPADYSKYEKLVAE